MVAALARVALSLAQAVPQARDTVVVRLDGSALADTAAVAIIVSAAVLLFLGGALVVTLREVRRAAGSLEWATRRLGEQAEPVMHRMRSISENLDYIATSVRVDIQRLNDAVARFTGRLGDAAGAVEEHVEDLNALLEVMHGEAQELFLDTASAVRGMREGVRALGRRSRGGEDGSGHRELRRPARAAQPDRESDPEPAEPEPTPSPGEAADDPQG